VIVSLQERWFTDLTRGAPPATDYGTEWFADRYFNKAQSRQRNKAIAYVGTEDFRSIGATLQSAPPVELYRLPRAMML
jgi:hypothetical protein